MYCDELFQFNSVLSKYSDCNFPKKILSLWRYYIKYISNNKNSFITHDYHALETVKKLMRFNLESVQGISNYQWFTLSHRTVNKIRKYAYLFTNKISYKFYFYPELQWIRVWIRYFYTSLNRVFYDLLFNR